MAWFSPGMRCANAWFVILSNDIVCCASLFYYTTIYQCASVVFFLLLPATTSFVVGCIIKFILFYYDTIGRWTIISLLFNIYYSRNSMHFLSSFLFTVASASNKSRSSSINANTSINLLYNI